MITPLPTGPSTPSSELTQPLVILHPLFVAIRSSLNRFRSFEELCRVQNGFGDLASLRSLQFVQKLNFLVWRNNTAELNQLAQNRRVVRAHANHGYHNL